ncbi:hypothetical protein EV359DRAFT_67602 [Lentinula novae-zelandiae]|nr:hypothetical protein EV359DRAFT_67602 [Lentinula novae-zelandiae]
MNSLHLGLGFRVKYTDYFVDLHLIISTISIDIGDLLKLVIRVWLEREVEEKEVEEKEVEEKEVEEKIWYSDRDKKRIQRLILRRRVQGKVSKSVTSVLVTSPITQNNEVLSRSQLSFFSSPIPIIVLAVAASRTSLLPEQSSSRTGTTTSGEVTTITEIYGYTNTTTFTSNSNSITVFHSLASTAGSDEASGTLWIHDNFGMYLVNVNNNTFGSGVQAIALSQDGRQGYIEVPEPHLESPERIFSEGYGQISQGSLTVFQNIFRITKSINPASQVILESASPDVAAKTALCPLWDGEANSVDNVLITTLPAPARLNDRTHQRYAARSNWENWVDLLNQRECIQVIVCINLLAKKIVKRGKRKGREREKEGRGKQYP